MIIVIFGSGGVFIFIFLLLLLGNFNQQFCADVHGFLVNNSLTIGLVSLGLSLGLSGLAVWLYKRWLALLAYFPLIFQMFLCIFLGLYSVVSAYPDSIFLTFFYMAVYIGFFLVDAFISTSVVGFCLDREWLWPIFLTGIALTFFIPTFF